MFELIQVRISMIFYGICYDIYRNLGDFSVAMVQVDASRREKKMLNFLRDKNELRHVP